MNGTRHAAQVLARHARYDPGIKVGRVEFRRFRMKNEAAAVFFQQFRIACKVARVSRQVFVRRKLRGIDENGYHHAVAHRSRPTHKRRVTFVQIAHGGHQAHGETLSFPSADRVAHFIYRRCNLHVRVTPQGRLKKNREILIEFCKNVVGSGKTFIVRRERSGPHGRRVIRKALLHFGTGGRKAPHEFRRKAFV